MNGYLLQIEELRGLIDTLSYGAQRITEANRALRDAEPTDLGSTSIDGAGRGFQDRWEYGTGKIAEASELMVQALEQTQRNYQAIEQEISKVFSPEGGAAGDGAARSAATPDPSSPISAALGNGS